MAFLSANESRSLANIKLAVIGHLEWVTFISVDKLPKPGVISHGLRTLELPAGGGAVAAVQMANLTQSKVHFFTSLGKDSLGEKSFEKLKEFGLILHVAWREKPTRKGISIIDRSGERAITVIGERLQPSFQDDLPWEKLKNFDAIFITASDPQIVREARKAKNVVVTPRLGLNTINKANIELDAVIGSGLDPDERFEANQLNLKPKLIISTEGENGGYLCPGGRFKAIKQNMPIIDSYGCGDSFAAGVTAGFGASFEISKAIHLGAKCGGICATRFGPYNQINDLSKTSE